MRIVLGGTFSPLHRGHRALFEKAFELGSGDTIIIGLTSDSMAASGRTREVEPYSERKLQLESYIETMLKKYPRTEVEIIEINEVYNILITKEIKADSLVVSEGRRHIGEKTNEHRIENGKTPLELIVVPYVLASDGKPIKATRIVNGEIDSEGRLLYKVTVAVGTNNDVKLRAVENIFGKIYSNLEMVKVEVSSGVREQPWEEETIKGAVTRAKAALENEVTGKKVTFGVGIEAGLFWDEFTHKCYDVQFCAIVDQGGRITYGHGPGFYYPPKVVEELKIGKTVGEK